MSILKAPRDPVKKREYFYIMFEKEISAAILSGGITGTPIYLNNGRLISSAEIIGGIKDPVMLDMLKTKDGFCKLVHSIGISILMEDVDQTVEFSFIFNGKVDPEKTGTRISISVPANGAETVLNVDDIAFRSGEQVPGQILYTFDKPGKVARVSVRFYLRDGFHAPVMEVQKQVDFAGDAYKKMIASSFIQSGNNYRLKKAIDKALNGETVTYAFIGGSITQGAGAAPIPTECFAYKSFCYFRDRFAKDKEKMKYVKAGVGGTPSELGMIRFERDVLKDGAVLPDIVVVEFGVNDDGDETQGACFESLVLRILNLPNKPAVILLFNVFADDKNLQERLSPVGIQYQLPMISILNAVVKQFRFNQEQGRVVSKSQFFYDMYHPTNTGHVIIADCINYLLEQTQSQVMDPEFIIDDVKAVIGNDFVNVKLFDRKCAWENIRYQCGGFSSVDTILQCVEMDLNLEPTPQFPHNWMKECENENQSFVLEGKFKSLIMVYKDSSDSNTGKADIFVDDNYVLTADPHFNGWTHCNPVILHRSDESLYHKVEIKMTPGHERKQFTILGFGYVE